VARFVTRGEQEFVPDSAEALFQALRRPDPSVAYLWSHQADMLRDYQKVADAEADIAVELPTGSGKTLVGLLIADWRRRAKSERVAYLCPTRHLAAQVGERAQGYGIPVVVLTGSSREWDAGEYMAYSRARSLFVGTYSALFNTNPRLSDPQTIVFDDAHAAEDPVASLWSVRASRDEELYRALFAIVSDALPEAFVQRLSDDEVDPTDRNAVEMLGPHQLAPVADEMRDAMVAHAEGDAHFGRLMIQDAIERCLLYISWRELLIRPLIPPTLYHHPFAQARQRVYLSATLGWGGELERSLGITKLHRLPVPPGWQEQGSGRRFFVFPDASLGDSEADQFTTAAIDRFGRVLGLAPSRYEIGQLQDLLPSTMKVLDANDLESRPSAAGKGRTATLLANRYDGLDLPDEACRLIVMSGLPSGTHLQERFLYERLGAQRVLAERVRTRIVQGAGRCTRNARDYAAVIVRGDRLVEFLSRAENVTPMQPDLQAEIDFGLSNSEQKGDELFELLELFLAQGSDWAEADAHIRRDAATKKQNSQRGAAELQASASLEVRAWQAAWRGDSLEASDLAAQAADALGGVAVAPYRSLWLYLAASWARESASTEQELEHVRQLEREAEACAKTLKWWPRFSERSAVREYTADFGPREERVIDVLRRLGLRGAKFGRHLDEMRGLLRERDAKPFERGLQLLGELLGFESVRPDGQGQPDTAWRDVGKWFVFEAKTEVPETTPIAMSEVRQALTHPDWLTEQFGWGAPEYIANAIVTAQRQIEPEAAAVARDLVVVHPDEIEHLADEAMSAIRQVRTRSPGLDDNEAASAVAVIFREGRLTTDMLSLRLMQRPVSKVPKTR
jgi:hypothetical protein